MEQISMDWRSLGKNKQYNEMNYKFTVYSTYLLRCLYPLQFIAMMSEKDTILEKEEQRRMI